MGTDHESWTKADGVKEVKDIRDLPWQKDGGPKLSEATAETAVVETGNPYDALQGAQPEGERPTNVVTEQSITGYPEPSGDALPPWVKVPSGLVIPPGVTIGYLRFRAAWTVAAHKGDRQCILWPLTDQDEQVGYMRIRSVDANAVSILAQHQIRAVDGHRVNWNAAETNHPGNVFSFWRDIGPKCRQLIVRWYHQNHSLDVAELADFFANCVAVRSAVLISS